MAGSLDCVIRIQSLELARAWLRREPEAPTYSDEDWTNLRPDHIAQYLMLHREAIERLLAQAWAELVHGSPTWGTLVIEVEALPDPLRLGVLHSPSCAACGGIAHRVLERHLVWNAIDVRLDGRWGGPGDTETDTTELVRDFAGLVRVKCPNDHEWSTRLLFEPTELDPLDPLPRYRVHCLKCRRQDLYVSQVVVTSSLPFGPRGFEITADADCDDVLVRCRSCSYEDTLDAYLLGDD